MPNPCLLCNTASVQLKKLYFSILTNLKKFIVLMHIPHPMKVCRIVFFSSFEVCKSSKEAQL